MLIYRIWVSVSDNFGGLGTLVGGPDLDQDGYREVYAVTIEVDDYRTRK